MLKPEETAVGRISFFINSVSDDQLPIILTLLSCLFTTRGLVGIFFLYGNLVRLGGQ